MTYVPHNQKCANTACTHIYGKHYTTNDDADTGCSVHNCVCVGFLMVVKADKPSRHSSGNYWDDR